MTQHKSRRLYKDVAILPDPPHWQITLDAKPILSPGRNVLKASTEKLAQAIAAEWAAQKDGINPRSMPLTQMLNTHADILAPDLGATCTRIMKYLDTDLVCYRMAMDTPRGRDLAAQQAQHWDRAVQFFAKRYAHTVHITDALTALRQDRALHAALQADIDAASAEARSLICLTTEIAGSVILAVAFWQRQIDHADLYAAMRVEELYNAHMAGDDHIGASDYEAPIKADLAALQTWRNALAGAE